MTRSELISGAMLGNIAKGRWDKATVKKIFDRACYETGRNVEKEIFELVMLSTVQCLYYDLGLNQTQIDLYAKKIEGMVEAFDLNTYSITDMKQALKEDFGFELVIDWGDRDAPTDEQLNRILGNL